MTIFWIIILVLSIILEAATVSLISVWFGVGAIAALLTSALTDNVLIQVVVFTLVTGLSIFFTRPFLQKIMPKNWIVRFELTNNSSATLDNIISQLLICPGVNIMKSIPDHCHRRAATI